MYGVDSVWVCTVRQYSNGLQCVLWCHKGLWIHSGGYRKRKAYLESHGEGERHPALKWSEFANGGTITNAKFPGGQIRR